MLYDPMNCNTPGFPVLHYLLEFAQLMSIESLMPSNHPTSVAPFSSCSQSFPASGSLPVSWLFASGDQSIGASTSASVPPVNIQGWFPLGLTDLISLLSKGLSRAFSSITVWKHQFFDAQLSLWSTLSLVHYYWKKTISLTIGPLLAKWCLCFFNMLSRFVIAFLPRSKHLFISWLQSLSAVILEPKKIKSVTVSTVFHLFALKWWDWMPGPIIMPF